MAVGIKNKEVKSSLSKSSPAKFLGNLFAGRGNIRRLKDAEKEYKEQMKSYQDFTFKNAFSENVFANMENPFEDLTVNQQASQFQAQQTQQSQSNILNALQGGGQFNAGNIQALANQGAIAAQRASASIGQQEAENRRMAAQGASRIQNMERQGMLQQQKGEAMVQGMEFDRQATQLGMSMQMVGNAQDAIAANKAMWGNIIGSVASGFVSGGMGNLSDTTNFFGKTK
tara:strand:- start:1085 stop:1768 length:684 start_codon:yes stop_codon:yes gene_type:complete